MSKFSLTLTPFNQIANLMRLNMPYTFNEVLLELEKEEWESGRRGRREAKGGVEARGDGLKVKGDR